MEVRETSGGRHNEEDEETWSMRAKEESTLREMAHKGILDLGEVNEERRPCNNKEKSKRTTR